MVFLFLKTFCLLASYWVYNPFLKFYSFLMKFFEWNLCLKFYFSCEFSWWCYFSFLKGWKIHLILVLISPQDYRSFLSALYLNFSWPSSWHSWWLSGWNCAKMKWSNFLSSIAWSSEQMEYMNIIFSNMFYSLGFSRLSSTTALLLWVTVKLIHIFFLRSYFLGFAVCISEGTENL